MEINNMKPVENAFAINAFVTKLWKMVEDSKTDDIICWSKSGKSILILDEVKFSYTLLPLYYKHSNMSSFIRQLNMYGFHKISNIVDYNPYNGEEKADYQFVHPHFQKGQMQLLKKIKRKVAGTKMFSNTSLQDSEDSQQFSKISSDLKCIYSHQKQVDSVLNNLKQENAVLWRELAVLRQKHKTQQQLVNKLIQFLVTMVQPSSRLGGVAGRKRWPLMIHDDPSKKLKTSSDSLRIHELDNADELSEDMPQDMNGIVNVEVQSPGSTSCQDASPNVQIDVVNVDPDVFINQENLEHIHESVKLLTELTVPDNSSNIPTLHPDTLEAATSSNVVDSDPIFMHSETEDSLLTSLISGNYNIESNIDGINLNKEVLKSADSTDSMSLATCDGNVPHSWLNTIEDSVSITQNDLEQIKKIFNGCNSVDAKYLLQLFNEVPSYGLTLNDDAWNNVDTIGTTAGMEVAPYDSGLIDFGEFLQDSTEPTDLTEVVNENSSLNTPEVTQSKSPFS